MHSRFMRGAARLAALAWLFGTPAEAQTPNALTLAQATAEALQNNLQLIAERLEVPVARAETIAARLRPNPTLTYAVDNLSAQRVFGTHPADTTDRTFAVAIPIETAGKRRLRIETAGFASRIAELQLADAIRRLRLEVATAYGDAVRAEQRAQLARNNLALLGDVVQVNTARVNAGAASQLELTRSQTAMLLLRSEASRADIDLATALLHLKSTIGHRGEMTAPIDVTPGEPAAASGTLDLSALMAEALRRRPDLEAARLTVEQRDASLRLALAQARVDPIGGLSYTRKGVAEIGSSYGANITLPLPLFDRNQGDIARSRAEKAVAEAQVAPTEEQVRTEVRTAYGQYLASRQILDQIRADLLPSAEKSRDTAAYVYRTHASSLLEFLDAERAYNDAMDSNFDAQAAVRTAAFQLEAAIGGPHETTE
jgi:cobalt-zinc-cadmium efflux system outer membrane protein